MAELAHRWGYDGAGLLAEGMEPLCRHVYSIWDALRKKSLMSCVIVMAHPSFGMTPTIRIFLAEENLKFEFFLISRCQTKRRMGTPIRHLV